MSYFCCSLVNHMFNALNHSYFMLMRIVVALMLSFWFHCWRLCFCIAWFVTADDQIRKSGLHLLLQSSLREPGYWLSVVSLTQVFSIQHGVCVCVCVAGLRGLVGIVNKQSLHASI